MKPDRAVLRVVVATAAAVCTLAISVLVAGPVGARAWDRDCSDFANQAAAQHYFTSHGGSRSNDFDNLDGDGDGVACESRPCPCSKATSPGGNGAPGIPEQRTIQAEVIRAVDGDTLNVRVIATGGEIDVRLIGIDTPETHRPGTPIECGGPKASASMHRLADGRRLTLVTDPTQDRFDRYGRLLAYAMRGSIDLNRVQIRRGWAEVYVYNNPFERVRTYRGTEKDARSRDVGVWGRCSGDFHSAS